jgi:hypothetical protein
MRKSLDFLLLATGVKPEPLIPVPSFAIVKTKEGFARVTLSLSLSEFFIHHNRTRFAMEAVSREMEMEVAPTVEQEREKKGVQEVENREEGDEEEGVEDEEEGEEERCELKFVDGTDPIDLVQGAYDGVDLYRRFERLEYEALAERERKRKAIQDQNQFPDRYVKKSVITICVSSLGSGEKREYLC